VISSRLGAIPEVVEDGRTGLLIEPGNVSALCEAMRRLAESRSARTEMGAAGRERFLRLYSIDVFRDALRALYDEALARA
jgi:glycosyltransferase involved in cell wall biosynthesis